MKYLLIGTALALAIQGNVECAQEQPANPVDEQEQKQAHDINVTLGISGPMVLSTKVTQFVVVYPDNRKMNINISDKSKLPARYNLASINSLKLSEGNFSTYYLSIYSGNTHLHPVQCQFRSPLDPIKRVSKIRIHSDFLMHPGAKSENKCYLEPVYENK